MMEDEGAAARVLSLLRETGALLEGHFLLSSGLHSERYFQCARLLQHPAYAAEVGAALAEACAGFGAEAVASPALGGVIIGHETGRALGTRAFFVERHRGEFCLRRGFELRPGEKVLVVEDVVTTGRSSLEAADAVGAAGGEVVGLGAIVDRSGGLNLPFPFRSLLGLKTPAFEPRDCPFCLKGDRPLTKPGSRELAVP
jgi:orotate phosphoribosyltransferase